MVFSYLFLVLGSTIYSFLSLDIILAWLDYMWKMKTRTLYFFLYSGKERKKLHLLGIASLNIHINEQSLASPNFAPLALLPPHSLSVCITFLLLCNFIFIQLTLPSCYFISSKTFIFFMHTPLCIFYYPPLFKNLMPTSSMCYYVLAFSLPTYRGA